MPPTVPSGEDFDLAAPYVWEHEPICYVRPSGHGLITGGKIYAFDRQGNLESCGELNLAILGRILSLCFPESANMQEVLDTLRAATPSIKPPPSPST